MKLTKLGTFKAVFLLMCLSMLAVGIGYIWHVIPASNFTGITPPSQFDTLEGWYAYNEITGWCLSFVAVVNITFLAIAGNKVKPASKFIIAILISLLISIISAAVAAEFLINFINL